MSTRIDGPPGLRAALAGGGPIVGDGAFGTRLQELGLPLGEMPEKWISGHPGRVRAIAAGYASAGATIVRTNTFGASRLRMQAGGLSGDCRALNVQAARLARAGAGTAAWVVGSIGPTGLYGHVDRSEISGGYRDQVEGLVSGGVDGILLETMVCQEEAVLAVEALKAVADLPVLVSFAWHSADGHDLETFDGGEPRGIADQMSELGVDAIGVNCVDLEIAERVVLALVRETPLAVSAFPNAGTPELVDGRPVYDVDQGELARRACGLFGVGASLVGGCCGTNEGFVRALANRAVAG